MAKDYVSIRNLKFLLHEVLEVAQLNQFERFQDYDEEAINFALDAAKQIGDQYLFPIYREMDQDKAVFADGEVQVHPKLREAIQAIAEGGWISANVDYEQGGQQMPLVVLNAALYVFYAANGNAAAYAFLTQGAANLLQAFGHADLKDTYIPEMYAGNWQGTMALTEPQAGSSLSDITTTAEPMEAGYYKLNGQKIYISGGDHTATDNVVHLLLARIKGAPVGTKGISLFAVPKYRLEDGELVPNDVTTAGIFGKMGQKGYVAAHLMFGEQDDCRAYLVGEPNRGLPYMFKMMNEARIGTGLMATGAASAAYYAALQYANERPQGRHPGNKDVHQPQVLIIEHADVRRMLLYQKSIVEGSISLLLQCSYYNDRYHVTEGKEQEDAHLLLELLTPIAKSFPAEMGIQSVSIGMQTLGGAGYTDDFPLEQYYRDIRVNAIYEGTTGIHGLDLLGRKILAADGRAMKLYMVELKAVIDEGMTLPALKPYAGQLAKYTKSLHEITMHLVQLAMKDRPEVFLADATLYLEYFGYVTIGWQWLRQGIVAQRQLQNDPAATDQAFYQGKIFTLQYFFEYELPKTLGLHQRLLSDNRLTLEVDPAVLY